MRGPGAHRRSGIRNEGRRVGWGLRPHARSGGTPTRLRRHRRLTGWWPALTYGPRNCRPSPQLQQMLPRVRRARHGPTEWVCHRWPWLLRAHWLQPEKAHLDAVCLASGVPPCSRCNQRGVQGTGRASDRTQLGQGRRHGPRASPPSASPASITPVKSTPLPGLHWWSKGYKRVLPAHGARVQFSVREPGPVCHS